MNLNVTIPEPRFHSGYRFRRDRSLSRVTHDETVSDYHVTVNRCGKVVKAFYVCTHEVNGQICTDYEVPEATIARATRLNDYHVQVKTKDGTWECTGEGPWYTKDEAETFAIAEGGGQRRVSLIDQISDQWCNCSG